MRLASTAAVGLISAITLLWGANGAGASSCVSSYGLSLSSCENALSAFDNIGCSCFSCVETNGQIELECTASNKTCQDSINDNQDDSSLNAPSLNSKHYAVIWSVYLVVALLLAGLTRGITYWRARPKADASTTVRGFVLCDAVSKDELFDNAKEWLKKFVLQPIATSIKPDDDSIDALIDMFGDLNKWAGLLLPIIRMFKSSPEKKEKMNRHSKYQGFLKIVTELIITLSLAFMLGTVVFNNESCSSTRTAKACSLCVCDTTCNGASIGCQDDCSCYDKTNCNGAHSCGFISSVSVTNSLVSTQSFLCESGDVSYTTGAEATTVILTEVFAIAMGVAVRSAKRGSTQQGLLILLSLLVAAVLAIFGWFYASRISKEQFNYDESYTSRRLKAIGSVLFASWWKDQLIDLAKALLLCIVGRLVYKMSGKTPNEKQIANAGSGSVVRPNDVHLDESAHPTSKSSQPSAPSPVPVGTGAKALDVAIAETCDAKQAQQ